MPRILLKCYITQYKNKFDQILVDLGINTWRSSAYLAKKIKDILIQPKKFPNYLKYGIKLIQNNISLKQ